MNNRRETKRQVIALRTMLRSNDLTSDQRNAMTAHIVELRNKLDSIESQVNPGEIAARREFLQKNKGMLDIFNTFWVILLAYTSDGFLSKEGYTKFHHAIEIALAGLPTYADVDQAAVDADWTHDKLLYGNLNKSAFFDMLFEVIETWTEIVDPTYYAAFAWALLDSIADTTSLPPKLRPHREMRCITKVQNEANMIRDYIKTKKVRAALSIESEMMQRIPEVQKRLHDRKRGMGVDEAQMSMIEALSLQASNSVEFSDSDGDSMHSATSLHQELLLQQMSWQDDEGREEDEVEEENGLEGDDVLGLMNDEIDDESVGSMAGISVTDSLNDDDLEGVDPSELRDQFGTPADGARGKSSKKDRRASKGGANGGQYGMRKPTASFLAYISGRRETRVALNGIYGTDSSLGSGSLSNSLGSGSQFDFSAIAMLPSTMATLSTDSGDESGTVMSSEMSSPGNRSRSPSHTPSQATPVQPQVLVIPSPSHRNNQGAVSPYGGNVGEKARFSQFVASGKKLGSFAKEYLVRHDMNSGLSIDHITGGSRAINSMMMAPQTVNNALSMTKTPLHRGLQSTYNLPAVAELTVQTAASSTGDLSLLGKTMCVPGGTTPKTRSAYMLLPPSQRGQDKRTPLGRTPHKTPNHSASARTLPRGNSSNRQADLSAPSGDEGDTARTASTHEEAPPTVSEKKGVTAAKVKGKRGIALVDVQVDSADGPGQEYGEAVADLKGGYFSVSDTQVQPYFRPEVTDELLALNRHNSQMSQVSQPRSVHIDLAQLGGSSKPNTPKITATTTAAKTEPPLDRSAFLVVESQPPPVEVRQVLQPVSPTAAARAAVTTSPSAKASVSSRQANSASPTARSGEFKPPVFSRAQSEIPPPDVASVEPTALQPTSMLPRQGFFEFHSAPVGSFYGKPQVRTVGTLQSGASSNRSLASDRPSVATISFPVSPVGSGFYPNSSTSPTRPALSRTNSNLSFADSDASYDSHEHMRSMESIYSHYDQDRNHGQKQKKGQEGQDRHTPMPIVHKKFDTDAHTSVETIFSDTMSSPPLSRQQFQPRGPKQDKKARISPGILLDPLRAPSPQSALHTGVDLEQSTTTLQPYVPVVKRGTNLAIRQPHQLPAKPESSTFPQGLYYSVVKHALDTRPQPNYNPSWDHRRASKNVRLSALRHPQVDVSLSLTTAPITLHSAKKIEEVISNADLQRQILVGTIPVERMKTPTNSLRTAPLTINIVADGKSEDVNTAAEPAPAAPVAAGTQSPLSTTKKGPGSVGAESNSRGSPVPQLVPSFTESAPLPSGTAIPAPDALLQSIVELDKVEMTDELRDEINSAGPGSLRTRSGSVSGSLDGSTAKSVHSSTSMPHLLIKPVVTPMPLSAHNSPERERDSPTKGLFTDHKGKLQLRELQELEEKKDMFEIHRNIDVTKNSGVSLATLQERASHVVEKTAVLAPIKHPYLTMNGTKHVLPDKIVSSIISVQKNKSLYEPNESVTESVFLGNSSSVLIRDSTTGHTSDVKTHHIPWLPGGSLEPPEHDRSNHLLGLREKLELQRVHPVDSNRQVITIRSQHAIREAFEQYVHQRLHNPAHSGVQFNQLPPSQQQQLLQQFQLQRGSLESSTGKEKGRTSSNSSVASNR